MQQLSFATDGQTRRGSGVKTAGRRCAEVSPDRERDAVPSPEACARELLAGIPAVMRFIRHQMRAHRGVELTVPQFRALIFVNQSDDASLSAMAEHLGLSLPSASRMVELLVQRGLVRRGVQCNDRRRVSLSLTRPGERAFRTALMATEVALAHGLRRLSRRSLGQIMTAMRILNRAFAPEDRRGGRPR
jgi:DNA-binding MarR family transcriptional regulator